MSSFVLRIIYNFTKSKLVIDSHIKAQMLPTFLVSSDLYIWPHLTMFNISYNCDFNQFFDIPTCDTLLNMVLKHEWKRYLVKKELLIIYYLWLFFSK